MEDLQTLHHIGQPPTIGMLEEREAQGYEDNPSDDEVLRQAIYSMQDGHQRCSCHQWVGHLQLLTIPQDFHIQDVSCSQEQVRIVDQESKYGQISDGENSPEVKHFIFRLQPTKP